MPALCFFRVGGFRNGRFTQRRRETERKALLSVPLRFCVRSGQFNVDQRGATPMRFSSSSTRVRLTRSLTPLFSRTA
jgi:hypothetical protein